MVVDFHNHLMPGVDDGAQTVAESRAAIQAFVRDGVSVIVTTPHVTAGITTKLNELTARLAELDGAYEKLQRLAGQQEGVRVERGVELALDIPEPDLSDPRLRLAGGSFLLVEFPSMSVPPRSEHVIGRLSAAGLTPIIAHPERYYGMREALALAGEWRSAGAYLQVNGGSLLGRYGFDARRTGFELLGRGWADYLCSDYHARGPTLVAQYRTLLEKLGAREQVFALMNTNPARMLEGKLPLPVQPLQLKRSIWSWVTEVFR